MAYLDVSLMMAALRTAPEEIEVPSGWRHHISSRHSFAFDRDRGVQIRAQCNCSALAVKSEQEPELLGAFGQWHTDYWWLLLINRQFASHFAPYSPLRRVLIDLTGRLHCWLRHGRHAHHRHEAGAIQPAE